MVSSQSGPLAGFRVLDISHHMAGPSATQKLGDLGADVIKVEPPGSGEWTRTRPIGDAWIGDMNTSYLSLNRNKRSIAINLKSAEGYQLFAELVKAADVLVGNFRPEVCRRLRVDFESIHAINPRLVYCSITGFGAEGPWSSHPGQDLLVQAFSGLAWNGGLDGEAPAPAPTFVADSMTGNHAVIGILAALIGRQTTGVGSEIEVDLLSSAMDLQTQEITTYLNSGELAPRPKERLAHPLINAPYGIHQTKDGWIAIAMAEAPVLAAALDLPELTKIEDWAEAYAQKEYVFRAVAQAISRLTTDEATARLESHKIWCGPVNNYADLVAHPQVAANGMVEQTSGPRGERINLVAFPIRISGMSRSIRRRPPQLGEHTDEILTEVGMSAEQGQWLRASGAIG